MNPPSSGAQTPEGTHSSNWFQTTDAALVPNEALTPNGFLTPNRRSPPTAAQATPATPSIPRTPLGEPIDQLSAAHQAADPVAWHLKYWLSMYVIGAMRRVGRVEPDLMLLRIFMEIGKIADEETKDGIQREWNQFHNEHRLEYYENFKREPQPTEEIKAYFRDLDRMLEDKNQKTREYLAQAEGFLLHQLRGANIEEARFWFERIALYYPKLLQEEAKDAEQGSSSSESSETDKADSDEEMSDGDESNVDN